MFALNFYSSLFADALRLGRKTATIRLGNKTDKYQEGQVVWITVGQRFGTRRKIFAAIIDRIEVKRLAEVTPREIERDHPHLRTHEELLAFLAAIYRRSVSLDDQVSVIHFSRIDVAEGAAQAEWRDLEALVTRPKATTRARKPRRPGARRARSRGSAKGARARRR